MLISVFQFSSLLLLKCKNNRIKNKITKLRKIIKKFLNFLNLNCTTYVKRKNSRQIVDCLTTSSCEYDGNL